MTVGPFLELQDERTSLLASDRRYRMPCGLTPGYDSRAADIGGVLKSESLPLPTGKSLPVSEIC